MHQNGVEIDYRRFLSLVEIRYPSCNTPEFRFYDYLELGKTESHSERQNLIYTIVCSLQKTKTILKSSVPFYPLGVGVQTVSLSHPTKDHMTTRVTDVQGNTFRRTDGTLQEKVLDKPGLERVLDWREYELTYDVGQSSHSRLDSSV